MQFFRGLAGRQEEADATTSRRESRQPLLGHRNSDDDYDDAENRRLSGPLRYENLQAALSSRKTHFIILGLVALDVTVLLANIFIELVECDMKGVPKPWVAPLRESLTTAGLVFSGLFLLELLLCVLAFGLSYFADWFHCLDGLVIIASLVIDLLSHGIVEDIASLVIVFRLFRFVKLIEEMSLGASVTMESMSKELEGLQKENQALRAGLYSQGELV